MLVSGGISNDAAYSLFNSLLHKICGSSETSRRSMKDLTELDERVLMDMLAEYTEKLTSTFKRFAENDPMYTECKQMVLHIARELHRRKKGNSGKSTQTPNGESAKSQEE